MMRPPLLTTLISFVLLMASSPRAPAQITGKVVTFRMGKVHRNHLAI